MRKRFDSAVARRFAGYKGSGAGKGPVHAAVFGVETHGYSETPLCFTNHGEGAIYAKAYLDKINGG